MNVNETIPEKVQDPKLPEVTAAGKMYAPLTDIVESEGSLIVSMDMPGVVKDRISVRLEKSVLTVDGTILPNRYDGWQLARAEYDSGNFSREFRLSSKIDSANIRASMQDGCLELTLPKAAEEKARVIKID